MTWVAQHEAELVLGAGDPARAERLLHDALTDIAAQPAPSVQAWCLLLRADTRLRLTRLDEAGADIAVARRLNAAAGNLWQEALADHLGGRIARDRSAPRDAAALQRRALALRLKCGYRPDVAAFLEALAGEYVARGDDRNAARLYAAAVALWAEIGWTRRPVDQPDYDADHTTLRERLGDEAVASAAAKALATGADAAVAAATRAARRRQAPATVGWESLTPTEREVVRLVAHGLSNQEVGQRLFMARGTVKVHLAHVFAKLGITSRTQLAAQVLHREQLSTAS